MSLSQRFLILSTSHKKQCMYTIYNNFCNNILCKILLSKVNYEIKESLLMLNEKSNEDRNIGILF